MNKRNEIAAMVGKALENNPPKSQYECCILGARISASIGVEPQNDADFIEAAHGMANGLFGPAFACADYAQKVLWIDMCERALREVAGKKI